ncbi:hypothetical protein JBKA6_0386 [Ichthyobacterium seriolicida]|uniref:Alpha-ketoglutarate decarboxylase n=2 Tax=Ichthyobacterium seriolicida TaxID=242600 RepID=A0A1J1DX15_9FLAO|nr:hypothetical protein JBKA6_0386 [Ichthyobacterium seriolicida]
MFVGIYTNCFSQKVSEEKSFWSDLKYGGTCGLYFHNNGGRIDLSPSVIKPLNKFVSLGLGLQFSYRGRKSGPYKSHHIMYGLDLIGEINPFDFARITCNYSHMILNTKSDDLRLVKKNEYVPSLYLGAGYVSKNIFIGLRYNIIPNYFGSHNSLEPVISLWF